MIVKTPEPPYYAVIFTSTRADDDPEYEKMAERMVHLAEQQDGYLGIESARESLGISVSYWTDLTAIAKWKDNAEHQFAQKMGRKKWYKTFKTRIAKVERD